MSLTTNGEILLLSYLLFIYNLYPQLQILPPNLPLEREFNEISQIFLPLISSLSYGTAVYDVKYGYGI